jgi:hypothetical protein
MFAPSQIQKRRSRRSPDSLPGTVTLLWLTGCLLLPLQAAAGNAPPHASVDRSGELRVTHGMTLHLNADLGNIRIQTLPEDAPQVLRYTVHVETDAPAPMGQKLLEYYSLTTRETVDAVYLNGAVRSDGSGHVRPRAKHRCR